jgi:hypothetical protein
MVVLTGTTTDRWKRSFSIRTSLNPAAWLQRHGSLNDHSVVHEPEAGRCQEHG